MSSCSSCSVNLFAAASDGVVYRIDRHPTMRVHPITPMAEADLRVHFGRQGWNEIGLIDVRAYSAGAANLKEAIKRRITEGETRTLFDVVGADDLAVLGQALAGLDLKHPIFCIGASSVSEALLSDQDVPQREANLPAFDGPIFAFAGSRSVVSAEQVARATRFRILVVDPDDLLEPTRAGELAMRCRTDLAARRHVLVQLSDRRSEAGGRELANASGRLVQAVVGAVRPGCLMIAGGDTASATVAHREIVFPKGAYVSRERGILKPLLDLSYQRFEYRNTGLEFAIH
jgi:uncharacterized protein YgbK (DUF1537 family)